MEYGIFKIYKYYWKKKIYKEKIKFYHIYDQFNNINNCNIFEIDNFEKTIWFLLLLIIED